MAEIVRNYGFLLLCFLLSFAISNIIPFEKIDDPSACRNDSDCVFNARCVPINNLSSAGICHCSRSCDNQIVPLGCKQERHCGSGNYCDKEQRLCLCKSSQTESCAKRNLAILLLNVSRETPFVGEHISIQCCLNIDPKSVKMRWLHNNSVELRSTETPDQFSKCFKLDINSVQYKDSGLYICSVITDALSKPIQKFQLVQVRSPTTLYLNVTPLNSTSILAEWILNAPIFVGINLKVETADRRRIYDKRNIMNETFHLITGLKPGQIYFITAETTSVKDNRTSADRKHAQTKEAIPDAPRLVEMRIQDKMHRTKCSLSWRLPLKQNGAVKHYEVNVWGVTRKIPGDVLTARHIPSSSTCPDLHNVPAHHQLNVCEFDNLWPNRNYSATVVAVNSAGRSEPATFTNMCLTNYAPPDREQLRTPNAEAKFPSNTLELNFSDPPDEINGPISCYYVAIVPFTYNTTREDMKLPNDIEFETYEKTLETNLYSEFQAKYAYIAESYKSFPTNTVIGDEKEQNERCSAFFQGRYAPKDGALPKDYKYTGFLIARIDPDESIPQTEDNKRYLKRSLAAYSQPSYVYSDYFDTVNLSESNFGDSGVILDGKMQDVNESITGDNSATENQSMYILTIMLSILVAAFILIALGMIFFLHKKGLLKHWLCFETNFVPHRNSFQELQRLPRDFPPIPVENIAYEYTEKHRNSDFLFTVEFEALPHFSDSFQTVASDLAENSTKNRYNDIKAYDVSRVKLSTINNDPNTDYINANFIQGYKGRKTFIAAQGPMQDTVSDFWRMIWEMDIRVVIMVTNLQEKYRPMCASYWPEHCSNVMYGMFDIQHVGSTQYSDYVVRRFKMKKSDIGNGLSNGSVQDNLLSSETAENVHEIVQYHYTGWNDYRAPEGTIGLLKFMKTLRKVDDYNRTTVLVHCSAGVGRTGTFIAIDAVMDQMEEERKADIFGFVSSMRRQRNFMVQSLEQYVFVYKALAELYLFGDTDMEAERFENHVNEITSSSSTEDNDNPFSVEYLKLFATLDDVRSTEISEKSGNLPKNRSDGYVPHDRNRVILQPVLGHNDASYINASVVKGYFFPYILTQDPMIGTIWDFWRMVVEQNVSSIVMLSDEDALENNEKYWPPELGRSVPYGTNPTINVQLTAEESGPNYTIRKMQISSTKHNCEIKEIVQYVYRNWAPSRQTVSCSTPKATCYLLDLIGKVLQRQSLFQDPGPIVVHCSNGSTRSGLYCCVSLLLERLIAEQRVDIFQTVKTLQAQRPFVIHSVEQYEFCYQAVLDYLQSFQ